MGKKLHWWEISFYNQDLDMKIKCEVRAASFDEALKKARQYDSRFDTGYVMGWREEQ